MQFGTYFFYAIIIVLLPIYYFLSQRNKSVLILFLNLFFLYVTNYKLSLVFLFIVLINFIYFVVGRNNSKIKTTLIMLNIGTLVFFKLFGINSIFSNKFTNIIIPIGLSYFIFEQVAALVLTEEKKSWKDFLNYIVSSIYVFKLTSGPIERLDQFSKKFGKKIIFNKNNISAGFYLFYWGLFKKYLLADNLNKIGIGMLLNDKLNGEGMFVCIMVCKYQVWANFSGYTDIARGLSKLYGIDLSINFKNPFNSLTIKEYWKKWHISLTSWIRDFVFFPLSITRFNKLGTSFLVLITFLVFGFWHEISINFLIYALLQAIMILISDKITPGLEKKISSINSSSIVGIINIIRKFYLYIFLISIPSVFFVSNTFENSIQIFKRLLSGWFDEINAQDIKIINNLLYYSMFIVAAICVEYLIEKNKISKFIFKNYWLETIKITTMIFILLYFSKSINSLEFIYKAY